MGTPNSLKPSPELIIAINIKKLMLDNGWDRKHLAKLIKMEYADLGYRLRKPNAFKVKELYRIASAGRVSVSKLFEKE